MKRAKRKVGLFAEGSSGTDPSSNEFQNLWLMLATKSGMRQPAVVVGFSKKSIVAMDPPSGVTLVGAPRLDVLIANEHSRKTFDVLIVAFDTEPKHQGLKKRCRRDEVLKVLRGLATSKTLPSGFRTDAEQLLTHYNTMPKPAQRPRGRPPRTKIDLVAMEPMFESLILADEAGVKTALEIKSPATGWVAFKKRTYRPDRDILEPDVALASPRVHGRVRGTFLTNKHAWARYILRQLPDASPAWAHEIASRLKLLA